MEMTDRDREGDGDGRKCQKEAVFRTPDILV